MSSQTSQMLAFLRDKGPATGAEISKAIDLERRAIGKLCRRAEQRDLIAHTQDKPRKYVLQPGWESRLGRKKWTRAATSLGMGTPAVNSIFALGGAHA